MPHDRQVSNRNAAKISRAQHRGFAIIELPVVLFILSILMLGLAALIWAIHGKIALGLIIPAGILAVLSGTMIYSLIGPYPKIKKK